MTPRTEPVDPESLELGRPGAVRPQRLAWSDRGMVASQHWLATAAGVEILADGGNAIDAAVATAFALGVCEPQASGLGGQTMMTAHLADPRRTFVLDGSSRAPNRATPDSLAKKERRRGYRSPTVPSTPATLGWALQTYGKLPLGRVLEPAIRIAEEGFPVSDLLHALMRREAKFLRRRTGGEVFLRNGRPWPVGSVLRQPALAGTLRKLATDGVEDFYTGDIARLVHEDLVANEGLLRDDDLAQIPWPIERRPVATRFESLRVVTMPPPGAGRVLVEMLNVLSNLPKRYWTLDTPEGAIHLAEIMRLGAIDRRDRPLDAALYSQVEDRRMTDRDYARVAAGRLRRAIRRKIKSQGETTHLSVADGEGNMVALTQSIERVFGSMVMTPELGFLYNNYMSAFEYEDISHPYYMRPNAAPWASVAPTIVFRGRKPWLAIGSPGSERIVTSVLQVLLRLKDHRPYEAVELPRLHCSLEGKVSLEASRFRDDIVRGLARHGFELDERDPYSFYLGCVQLVVRDRRGFVGVADPRRDGSAGGPA